MRPEQLTLFDDTPEYDAFVEKFKPKKTTDDCYTPPLVYDAVADWVAETYGLDREKFVRPFYPDGDYEAEDYPADCVVVDNPPFSILKQIKQFYHEHGILFFLFAPGLTLFSSSDEKETYITAYADITYENGANVKTGFVTNLTPDILVQSAPELTQRIKEANAEALKASRRELPKYKYPVNVLTASMGNYLSSHCVGWTLRREDAAFVRCLDAQRPAGKNIFGGGFLLSERAAAIAWGLSDRERAIIAQLGREDA